MTIRLQRLLPAIVLTLCLVRIRSEPLSVKICIPYTDGERGRFLEKCTNAAGLANTEDLNFECVPGGSAEECMALIESGEAHLTTLDGADVLTANENFGLVPIISENTGSDVPGGTYYAVAVVNKDFCEDDTTLDDLKGVRSCHTGYRKTAGWKIPVGTLLEHVDEFIRMPTDDDVNDDAELVSAFFEDVCAPRIAEGGPQNGEGGEGERYEPLCTACKGDCTTNDQYYDYQGAFRCLMEGNGDVAFVKHTTVLDYAADGSLDPVLRAWADKDKEDFQLLCVDGGCKDVTEFEDCNLALAPGHAMVTSKELGFGGDEAETGLAIQAAIIDAAENTDFLEESKALTSNFIWSEGTTGLEPIEKGMEDYLPEESLRAFLAFESLPTAANQGPPATGIYCATSEEELEFCEKMVEMMNELSPEIEWGCVQRSSSRECMQAIHQEDADWMTVSALDTYIAHSRYDLTAIAASEGALGDGYSYYSIALVKKEFCEDNEEAILADLKGKNSCHTGYRRNAGWDMPVGKLVSLGIMDPVREDPLVANDAETAASFFADSCAPNREGSGPMRGKNDTFEAFEPLCTACGESCGEDSPYYAYEGAHRCLAEDAGDVAFVKHTTPTDYEDAFDPDDLRLVCPVREGCASVEDYEECNLGKVPSRAVINRDRSVHTATLRDALLALAEEEDFMDLVQNEDNNPDNHVFIASYGLVGLEGGTRGFLGDTFDIYEALAELDAPSGEIVKVCIPYEVNIEDIAECTDIFSEIDIQGVTFECVGGGDSETCMQQLYDGDAHLTALDGGDIFRGHNLYGLVPLVSEVGEDGIEGTYYSVAVVNADFCDEDTTLASLEGMRSCHTGYRKMAGWRIPVGTLLSEVDSFNVTGKKSNIQDDAELVASFFDQVCAPRVSSNGPQMTVSGEGEPWEDLCTSCKGDCSTNDQYYDYSGAFRCLSEEAGDVAFVKHTTVSDYASDGKEDEVFRAWSEKPASDFKLLCKEGGCADVDEYRDCHLALVPSHSIVAAPSFGKDESLYDLGLRIQDGIIEASDKSEFFDDARGFVQDFPFSSSTESLVAVEGGYEGYITPDAAAALDAFAELAQGERRPNPGNLATFCATTEAQLEACEENVERIYSKIEPDFKWGCIQEDSVDECATAIDKGIAQFMAATPKEALEALESHSLNAIVAEAIGSEKETEVHSVIVIDEENCDDTLFIADLEGEDICFPHYGSDSGWEVPLSVMISQGLLPKPKEVEEPTNSMQGVSDFFGEICAPHDSESEVASETLCEACPEEDCNVDGVNSGPSGAVECMKSKPMGVAVTDNTMFSDKESAEDIRLLCPFKRGCQDVDSYETCNFGQVPTDVILVSEADDTSYISRLRTILVEASNNKNHNSILHNTRDSGELVSITGSTNSHLLRYSFALETFSEFDA